MSFQLVRVLVVMYCATPFCVNDDDDDSDNNDDGDDGDDAALAWGFLSV